MRTHCNKFKCNFNRNYDNEEPSSFRVCFYGNYRGCDLIKVILEKSLLLWLVHIKYAFG